jgi:hypothetical protein
MQAYGLVFYAWLFNRKIPFSNQSLGHLKHHRMIDDSKARKHLSHRSRPLENTLEDAFLWITKNPNLNNARSQRV